MTIEELVAVFRRYLYLPDPGPLLVVVAAVVANLLGGDPVWLLLVGPPSSGKTELLSSLGRLAHVHAVSTFTEAGLLSGSVSRRPGATGGLLAEVGERGIVVCKDFTSILSESAEVRRGLLAALREVYDGSWVRRLGVDGGRTIAWQGKLGLLGAVTETIDRHAAVIGAMGERMVLYRMPILDDDARLEQARAALANTGRQEAIRAELAEAVSTFVGALDVDPEPEPIDGDGADSLVRLADLATRCRSIVERDERTKEVELVPQPEAAARLQAALLQLTRGLWAIGVPDREVQCIILKVALDGMTKARRAVVEVMVATRPGVLWSSAQVGDAVGLPTDLAARTLADLAAHRIVERHADGRVHHWGPSEWLVTRWRELDLPRADDATEAGGS